jgi:Holliday junction resolvasome RuvABC endonuclease subunit
VGSVKRRRPVCWIGIDPSYSGYGIVQLSEHDNCLVERLQFTPKKTGTGAARLDTIFRELTEKFWAIGVAYTVEAVALEGYAMHAKFGREKAGELGGLTKIAIAHELGMEPLIVPPTSLKRFVTGSGGASKDDMRAAVEEKWGERFSSHDIADAYGLAQMARASLHGTDVDHEREALDNLMSRVKPISRT